MWVSAVVPADAAAQTVVAWLGPFDQGLLRLYTVVAVLAGARVLIKWKSIALEFVLHQRAGLSYAWPVIPRRRIQKGRNNTSSSSTKGKGAVNTRSSGSSTSQAAKPAAAKPASAAVMSVDDGDDGFDEAACVQREGSMLCVSMRPRSASSASGTGEDRQEAAAGSRGGAAAGMDGGSSKAAVGGWRGSSSGSSSSGGQGEVPWPAQSTQDDGVERLLLPLDRCDRSGVCIVSLLVVQLDELSVSSRCLGLKFRTEYFEARCPISKCRQCFEPAVAN